MDHVASPEAPDARCSLDTQLAEPVLVVELELLESPQRGTGQVLDGMCLFPRLGPNTLPAVIVSKPRSLSCSSRSAAPSTRCQPHGPSRSRVDSRQETNSEDLPCSGGCFAANPSFLQAVSVAYPNRRIFGATVRTA
jgi:hypothetical protein